MKLVQTEQESAAFLAELKRCPLPATSVIAEIELRRAGRRAGITPETIDAALDPLALVALDDPVRELAGHVGTRRLRSLGAGHLATALSLGGELDGFACCDERLTADADAPGYPSSTQLDGPQET